MLLTRTGKTSIDFVFARKMVDYASEFEEIMDGHPHLLCQATWASVDYINRKLPKGMYWDNENGYIVDNNDENYSDHEKVEFRGKTYAVCPEAYERLDALMEGAVEEGIKEIFGTATRINGR